MRSRHESRSVATTCRGFAGQVFGALTRRLAAAGVAVVVLAMAAHALTGTEPPAAAARTANPKTEPASTPPLIFVPDGLVPGQAVPVVVALHGHAGNAVEFAGYYRRVVAALGAILIVPQGSHPTGPGRYQWGSSAEAGASVDQALALVRARYTIDDERVVLTGFSQGGIMTYRIGLSQPDRYRGLVPVAGHYKSPMLGDRRGSAGAQRVYIMVGSLDGVAGTNRQAARELEAAGFPVHLEVYQGLGHAYPEASDAELRKALAWVLAADPEGR